MKFILFMDAIIIFIKYYIQYIPIYVWVWVQWVYEHVQQLLSFTVASIILMKSVMNVHRYKKTHNNKNKKRITKKKQS